jgi:hypothetical protein
MKRLTELDIMRGILLLMMVVNHSPSSLRRFTDQPVGFFTTAEAFVFVSAFLAGILFRRQRSLHRHCSSFSLQLLAKIFHFWGRAVLSANATHAVRPKDSSPQHVDHPAAGFSREHELPALAQNLITHSG